MTRFNLRDDPFGGRDSTSFCQCGLWLRGTGGLLTDKPKLSLQAFRFPFVAFTRRDGTVSFWGRTPDSNATALVIEQNVGSGWVRIDTATSGKRGIFAGTAGPRSKTATLRARIVATNDASVPFGLVRPTNLPICVFWHLLTRMDRTAPERRLVRSRSAVGLPG